MSFHSVTDAVNCPYVLRPSGALIRCIEVITVTAVFDTHIQRPNHYARFGLRAGFRSLATATRDALERRHNQRPRHNIESRSPAKAHGINGPLKVSISILLRTLTAPAPCRAYKNILLAVCYPDEAHRPGHVLKPDTIMSRIQHYCDLWLIPLALPSPHDGFCMRLTSSRGMPTD